MPSHFETLQSLIRKNNASELYNQLKDYKNRDQSFVQGNLPFRNQQTTLVHEAVDQDSVDMLRILMDFDIPLEFVDAQNKTPIELAQSKGYKKIAGILLGRSEFQKRLKINSNPFHSSFSTALSNTYDALEKIQDGEGKMLNFALGDTGVGKSAFINYLNGVRYALKYHENSVRPTLQPVSNANKIVTKVGDDGLVSQTLYPEVVLTQTDHGPLYLADVAGLNGSRQPYVEVAATLSISELADKAEQIKSILFVVDCASFETLRGERFKAGVRTLMRIFGGNSQKIDEKQLMQALFFVVTKTEELSEARKSRGLSPVNPTLIISSFITPYKEKLLNDLPSLDESARAEVLIEIRILDLMEKHPEQIIVTNILDEGQTGESLLSKLKQSPGIGKQAVNLLDIDKHQNHLIQALSMAAEDYTGSHDKVKRQLPSQIKLYEDRQFQLESNIKNWELEINENKNFLDKEITPEDLKTKITQHELRINDLMDLDKRKWMLDLGRIVGEINYEKRTQSELDTDEPTKWLTQPFRFVHNPEIVYVRQTVRAGSDSRQDLMNTVADRVRDLGIAFSPANPVIGGIGAVVGSVLGSILGGGRQKIEVNVPQISSEKKAYTFENNNNSAPGKILSITRTIYPSNAGEFSEPTINNNQFTCKLDYIAGASFYAEIEVNIAKRDVPENAVKLEKIEKVIKQLEENKKQVERNIETIDQEVRQLREEISTYQDNTVTSVKRIEQLNHEISIRKASIVEAKEVLTKVGQELDQTKQELQVAQDIWHFQQQEYRMMYQVITEFELSTTEQLKMFVNSYHQQETIYNNAESSHYGGHNEDTFNHFGFSGAKASIIELRTAFFFNRDQPKLPSRQLTQLTMLPSEFVDDIQKKSVLEGSQNSFGATYSKITDYDGWSCTYRNEELHCMNPENSQITRTVKRLPYSRPWSELNGDTYNQCITLEKGHVQVTHCEGEQTEFIEIQPGTPPSLLNSVTQSTLWGATTAIVPEAIGDALYLSGYFSRENANLTTHVVNLSMIAATGSYVPVAVNWITNTVLQKVGFTASTSRMVSNSVSFLTSLGQDITPTNIALSVACYAGSKMGFWAEKKVVQRVEQARQHVQTNLQKLSR